MELSILLLTFGSSEQFRRVKAIKNTLRGRRTVSNLYWALQYDMLDFVDSLHGTDFGEDDVAVKQLKAHGLADTDDNFQFKLTAKGADQQEEYLSRLLPLKYLALGSRYDVAKFMRRFSFAVQIVSEFSYTNNKYYPQSINYFEDQLLKRWFVQTKHTDLPAQFHQLLDGFLNGLANDELANLFVQSLVGHGFSGLTADQIATQDHSDVTVVNLEWLQTYGVLLERVLKLPDDNPFKMLTMGLEKPVIAQSAKETFEMFVHQEDGSLNTIAQKRRVKLTTVYEHLLEAAIMLPVTKFPYKVLIRPEIKLHLEESHPVNVGSWTFEAAKQEIPDLSFFEFRLFQIYRSKSANEN